MAGVFDIVCNTVTISWLCNGLAGVFDIVCNTVTAGCLVQTTKQNKTNFGIQEFRLTNTCLTFIQYCQFVTVVHPECLFYEKYLHHVINHWHVFSRAYFMDPFTTVYSRYINTHNLHKFVQKYFKKILYSRKNCEIKSAKIHKKCICTRKHLLTYGRNQVSQSGDLIPCKCSRR